MIILFLGISLSLQAQQQEELRLLREQTVTVKEKKSYDYLKDGGNSLQQFFFSLFILYKGFVSSQDAVSCVFYPSCSEYAMQAIREQGFFLGGLNAFDRLSRCNALSPEQYSLYPGTHLFYDPLHPGEKIPEHEHVHEHR